MDQEEIRIKLPRYLARWLQEFSKAIAMTPDQLLANILNYYYEAWKVGFERRMKLELEPFEGPKQIDVKALLEEYVNAKRNYINNYVYVLDRFLSWMSEKKLKIEDISEDHIVEFLNEYSGGKLKPKTISSYKYVIKDFVKFAQNKIKYIQG